mmetsp:Transcript_97018/g.274128  ORF Transcript_97018/g.274128 Transcript_97018/m.274128 type:complete len:206 (+) Transcript_97018:96-713(+)
MNQRSWPSLAAHGVVRGQRSFLIRQRLHMGTDSQQSVACPACLSNSSVRFKQSWIRVSACCKLPFHAADSARDTFNAAAKRPLPASQPTVRESMSARRLRRLSISLHALRCSSSATALFPASANRLRSSFTSASKAWQSSKLSRKADTLALASLCAVSASLRRALSSALLLTAWPLSRATTADMSRISASFCCTICFNVSTWLTF